MAPQESSSVVQIGEWIVHPAIDSISRGPETQKLEPRAMRLLMCLANSAGEVVSVERLLTEVWAGVVVGSASVYEAVSQLRKILSDVDPNPTYIVTVPRKGYRLIASLQRTGAARTIPEKSIAVLPFADMSEKKDQEYFADGIAEEVLNRLAKVPGLKVVGRASSFQFKDKAADPANIGAALGVAYLLEGSVRKEADLVRVTAQLVEARSGAQRWSDRFDSELVSTLNVQDTIAVQIARALQIAVAVDTVPRSSVKSSQALDAYLRGLQSRNRQSRESCEAAVANFQQTLAMDATFAPAAIGLADTYVVKGDRGMVTDASRVRTSP
jgi:transcriptional activator of cad operon